MVEAALRIPQLLLDNSVGLHRAETNYQTMDKWKSAITIWKAGKAQLESKRAAVNHVC